MVLKRSAVIADIDKRHPDDFLKNRVILVTGAAGCLGRVAAKTFAKFGAVVILLDKTVQGLESVYDEILGSGGTKPAIYPFDLSGANFDDYVQLAETLEDKYAKLDGLLHNAAELGDLSPVEHISAKTWNKVLNVNLNGPYMLTRILLPLLKKSEDAAIVFTSDSSGRTGKAYWGAYGVSKIAVEGFARILADELESEPNVRVNTIIPGPVATPIRNRAYPGEPVGKMRAPETLQKWYLYLFGSTSVGLTGRIFEATATTDQLNE